MRNAATCSPPKARDISASIADLRRRLCEVGRIAPVARLASGAQASPLGRVCRSVPNLHRQASDSCSSIASQLWDAPFPGSANSDECNDEVSGFLFFLQNGLRIN